MSLTNEIEKHGFKAKKQKDGSVIVGVPFLTDRGRTRLAWSKVWTYREAINLLNRS